MPFVRIDAQNASDQLLRGLGDAVHDALIEAIGIPADDRFQVLTNGESKVIADEGYLGIRRDENAAVIQVTLREGRSDEQKKAFYAAVAAKATLIGIEPRNLVILLTENGLADWSFGEGVAQYLT